jgi:hypothetical protein
LLTREQVARRSFPACQVCAPNYRKPEGRVSAGLGWPVGDGKCHLHAGPALRVMTPSVALSAAYGALPRALVCLLRGHRWTPDACGYRCTRCPVWIDE